MRVFSDNNDGAEGWIGSVVHLFITYSVAERYYKL